MLAKTFAGLEEVLEQELIELGAEEITPVVRGVKFSGSKEILYKANFCLRTALRVLVIIGEYKIKNADELYQVTQEIDWTKHFDLKQSFAVNSTVHSKAFNNSMFVSLKAKDAIVDQFREKLGRRPSVNIEEPDFRINVHVSNENVSISLDSSGESLHKRGYRVGQNEASMSEVLAAGMLKLMGWTGESDLYDPMCGSGTIAIEAALIARNIPPGIFRPKFAFEDWKDFDADIFDEIYNDDYERKFEHKVYASDIAMANIRLTLANAKNAGLKRSLVASMCDFKDLETSGDSGVVVMNPPYGKRMREEREMQGLYKLIGDTLKSNFTGFEAWVFSGSEDGLKNIGLRPSKRFKLVNGAIDCELRKFDLYQGTKKGAYDDDDDSSRGFGNREYSSRDDRSPRRGGFNRPDDGDRNRSFGDRRSSYDNNQNDRGYSGRRRSNDDRNF